MNFYLEENFIGIILVSNPPAMKKTFVRCVLITSVYFAPLMLLGSSLSYGQEELHLCLSLNKITDIERPLCLTSWLSEKITNHEYLSLGKSLNNFHQ